MTFEYSYPAALHRVRRAALASVMATDYGRDVDPHADAHVEYADECLALAARDLVEAVEAMQADKWPVGWDRVAAFPPAVPTTEGETQP